jgi:hypothetical protein
MPWEYPRIHNIITELSSKRSPSETPYRWLEPAPRAPARPSPRTDPVPGPPQPALALAPRMPSQSIPARVWCMSRDECACSALFAGKRGSDEHWRLPDAKGSRVGGAWCHLLLDGNMNAQLVLGEAGGGGRGGFTLVEACPRALVACPRAFSPGAGMRSFALSFEPARLQSGGCARERIAGIRRERGQSSL